MYAELFSFPPYKSAFIFFCHCPASFWRGRTLSDMPRSQSIPHSFLLLWEIEISHCCFSLVEYLISASVLLIFVHQHICLNLLRWILFIAGTLGSNCYTSSEKTPKGLSILYWTANAITSLRSKQVLYWESLVSGHGRLYNGPQRS